MRVVRYVVAERDRTSGHRRGFLRSAWYMDQDSLFSAAESARLQAIFKWFNENLPTPTRMSRNRNAGHKKKHALSWFKDTAHAHLKYAREVADLMRIRDVVVEMISTDRPGYVVYEDEYQLVALPFADTQT